MFAKLREVIYPHKCMICGEVLQNREEYVCQICEEKVARDNWCPRCSKPYYVEGEVCPYCQEISAGIAKIEALFLYRGRYKRVVLRWKYKGIRKYGIGFARQMNNVGIVERLEELDALIPIPISRKRYKARGFNQAEDLARELSNLSGVPMYNVLLRTEDTKPQSECSYEQREINILNTIKVNPEIDDIIVKEEINVALIDDIYTTGSTAKECIKALRKKYKIKKVYVVVVCVAV